MTDILGSISNFFARHRAHCAEHEVYQADCDACVKANHSDYVTDWSATDTEFPAGDSSPSIDMPAPVDTSVPDTSSVDVSGSSDFGGFDGGDSGGGGASGDF